MTHIVAPIAPTSAAEFLQLASDAAAQGADAVELRLDTSLSQGGDGAALLAAITDCPLPVLVTNRSPDEGGDWTGDEAKRLDWLLQADTAGAAWIDVELIALPRLPRHPTQADLVLSYHDFVGMGDDLPGKIRSAVNAGASVAKVAVTPTDAHDLATIADLYEEFPEVQICAIAMGEAGLPSRLLAGCWGAAFTFGRLEGAGGSAPGQPTVAELAGRYRIHNQGPDTLIFGVIANPVAHSLSPHIHNAAFAHDELDAVYVPFLVEDAPRFWEACGDWIDGLSITIPHKDTLISAMDGVEDLALQIGAINTVYRDDEGRPLGANTDAQAVIECLSESAGGLGDRKALVLGAGGVSRAIAFALQDAGAEVLIANRTVERAQELATAVGCSATTFDEASEFPYDILVNGTSVGMREEKTPWPSERHRPGSVVFDTVYTPLETTLLQEAEAAQANCVCGMRMFINQALGQYFRWTGREAPAEVMQRAALEALGSPPGC